MNDATSNNRSVGELLRAALVGLLAGAAALSIGELAAALAAPRPGPVIAVANRVIDEAPAWFVDFGKDVFGLADKPALVLGTIIISLLIAAGLGVASRRSLLPGVVGIAVFGLVGLWAIAVDSQGGFGIGLAVSLAAVAAGVLTLSVLRVRAGFAPAAAPQRASLPPTMDPSADREERPSVVTDTPVDPAVTRRAFLNTAGAIGATAAIATVGANVLRARSSASDARDAVQLDSALTATDLETRSTLAPTVAMAAVAPMAPAVLRKARRVT
ncbi:MAG: hypothetical protein AAFN30_18930, partial [Actinomycetota bacterium]